MALPDPKNLAYDGITSGNGKCMTYDGIICDMLSKTWNKIVYFTVYLTRQINFKTQR